MHRIGHRLPFGQDEQGWLGATILHGGGHIHGRRLRRDHQQILGVEFMHIAHDARMAPGRLCELHEAGKARCGIGERMRPAIAAGFEVGRIGAQHDQADKAANAQRQHQRDRADLEGRGLSAPANGDIAHAGALALWPQLLVWAKSA